jgi:hypothetical protein
MTCEVDGRSGTDRRRGHENDQKYGKKKAADRYATPDRWVPLVSASVFLNSLTWHRALAKMAVVHH